MKKQTYSLLLLFFLTGFVASAQMSPPVVPERVTFADISVALDPDARRIVQQDVNSLMTNQQYWVAKLDRVVLYFPMIESILIGEKVPTDFKYLAVQESSLSPDAVSTSNAVGYWQFKKETAALNGIRVDDEIDERKSITASTRAAATYLKKSNAQFNNWVASLYSYYLGATGITKLIPPDWAYAREVALDGRTDRYILRFFAHKIAIENALKTHQTSNRFALIEYPKGGGKTMKAIAEELGIDEFELRKYNRWVLGEAVPTDKAYVMAVPVASNQINDVRQKIGTVASVGASNAPEVAQSDVGFPVLRRVTTNTSGKNDPILYEINGLPGIQAQASDNAATLSRKSKISLSSFLRYNDLDESDRIIANDIYYLSKKRKKALVPFHTVREGETSHSISQRYGLRLRKLLRYNRVDRGQQLAAGRVMWLRERRPAKTPVEIINAPTPPVYDQTPAPPARQEVVATAPAGRNAGTTNRPVSGSEGVPRNASERKMYQPKLVGGGVTPNDGAAAPATTEPIAQPASVSPSRPAPTTSSSGNADGSQRVVIVRSQDADGTTKTVPVATTPEVAGKVNTSEDGWTPSGTKAVRESDTYTRMRPAKTPSASSAPSGYEGPSEQQADGSITSVTTKAPPRQTPPAVVKADRREAEASVVEATDKVEKKVTAPTVTMTEKKPERSTSSSVDKVAPTVTMAEKKSVTSSVASTPTPSVATSASAGRSLTTHIVEKGETYYGIARKYGLKLNDLLELNNRTLENKLEAGQRLKVMNGENSEQASVKVEQVTTKVESKVEPAVSTKKSSETLPAPQSGATYHTVAKGENLFRISKIYNVSVPELQEWNNLSTAYVREGQKIRVAKP